MLQQKNFWFQSYIRKRTAVLIDMIAQRGCDGIEESLMSVIPHLQHLMADSDPGVAIAATSALSESYKVTIYTVSYF